MATNTSPDVLQGYALLGWRMAVDPDLGIFRRFTALNAQNLLYMQAELSNLEWKLREREKLNNDFDDSDPRSRYAHDWDSLREDRRDPNGELSQWELCLELREKLRLYSRSARSCSRRPA